ncbi:MAG: phenylalanine--tRNA ligase subunit beta [Clostridiales bacterium]|nr:phenylalanine--tRNA ligase subunit beta [Clostridiales bacterium]
MKISVAWIKEYLEPDISAPEIIDALNRIGLMVENREERDGDIVLDVETYANRPDTLGHLGMAREIAAALGARLKAKDWPLLEVPVDTAEVVDVQVQDEALCPRYCGLVVKGIKVGPSPLWLRQKIEAVGLNPVNNVVDVTNFVLFATSQPIHAFDLEKIAGRRIIVRRARKRERLLCLDGTERELQPEMLVIADEAKPVALAGVIGGQESAVTDETKDVFIESACFDPVSVRATRKAAGLQTDASYRFERGADISFPPQAALMAASCLVQFGGKATRGIIDVYPAPRKKKEMVLRHRRVIDLLGVDVSEKFIIQTLQDLEFEVDIQQPGVWRVKVPTFRVDIDREADLIEEIARFFGYENIPSVLAPLKVVEPIADKKREKLARLRPILFHHGFNEVINFSFSDPDREKHLETGLEPVELRNPISSKASLLRTSLLGGLLDTLAWNRNRGLEAVHIFEVGNIYYRRDQEDVESLALGLLSMDPQAEPVWGVAKEKACFFYIKAACEALLTNLRYEPFSFSHEDHPLFEPGNCLSLAYKEERVGFLGLVRRTILKAFDVKEEDVYAAELDLERLFSKQPKAFAFTPVAKFPAVIRDISLLVPGDVSFQDLKRTIEKASLSILEEFKLVDRYKGEPIPRDKSSLSFRFVFRHSQRTLLAEEVDKAVKQILNQLRRTHQVQLREGGKIDNRTRKN